jgi:hypothetical protein
MKYQAKRLEANSPGSNPRMRVNTPGISQTNAVTPERVSEALKRQAATA